VIDVVAWNGTATAMLVVELKTRIVDVNDLMSTMDVRRRVSTRIAKTAHPCRVSRIRSTAWTRGGNVPSGCGLKHG